LFTKISWKYTISVEVKKMKKDNRDNSYEATKRQKAVKIKGCKIDRR